MTQAWTQTAPTKAFAIYLDGAWYGEGDTAETAWFAARRQVNAEHCRYGHAMYAKLRREGKVLANNKNL